MRLGYSILLGEMIDAAQLEYRDCEHFQVVCPQCQEPVFKVHREGGKETHYLAHYAAKAAYQDTCERRAARYTPAELEAANHIARNQRLQYFLDKLRHVLAQSPIYARDADVVHRRLNKAPGVAEFRDLVWQNIRAHRHETFETAADDYLYNLEVAGWGISTTFSKARQRQIAGDMWAMLTSAPGRAGFDYLCNHAILRETGNVAGSARQETGVLRYAMETQFNYINGLMTLKKPKVLRLLGEMAVTRMPAGLNKVRGVEDDEDSTYLSRLFGNTVIEMIGTLMTLPYFELLRQRYAEPGKEYPLPTEQVGPKVAGPADPVYPRTPGTQ